MRAIAVLLLCGCDKLLGLGSVTTPAPADAPPDALAPGNWTAVAAAFATTCAIEAGDGSLWCWGRNEVGEAAAGTADEVGAPMRVDTSRWIAISGHGDGQSMCGLQYDHSLWCWGDDTYDQLGPNGPMTPTPTPVQVAGTWSEVSVARDHTCGVMMDGTLRCWGADSAGQLGAGLQGAAIATPVQVMGTWKTVSAGNGSTCAIRSDDSLWCWGTNAYGELGDGTFMNRPVPVAINSGTTYARVSVGTNFACAIRSDGRLRCWGQNLRGNLGDSTTIDHSLPAAVGDDDAGWMDVSAGDGTACATRGDGTLWCWGDNRFGQLATDRVALSSTPRQIDVGHVMFTAVATGTYHTCALSADQNLWCAGGDGYGQLADSPIHRVPVQVAGTWHAPVAGELATCAQDAANTLACWGNNRNGQLGDGSFSPRQVPVSVLPGAPASVTSGQYTTCALLGGASWCWGLNSSSEFGDGATTGAIVPAAVAITPDDWTEVHVSEGSIYYGNAAHMCGIDRAAEAYCWGDNTYEQCTTSANPMRTPESVTGSVTAIAVGTAHTCLLDGSGVECWGRGNKGQVGDGSFTDHASPVGVTVPFTPVRLVSGTATSCALDVSGNAACWGANTDGQLGLGTRSDVGSPTPIAKQWLALGIGDQHMCGVASDHTLWCWGQDQRGELGDGGSTASFTPVQVGSDSDWNELAVSRTHACATKLDGRLYCWGENQDGELGDGRAWRASLLIVPAP